MQHFRYNPIFIHYECFSETGSQGFDKTNRYLCAGSADHSHVMQTYDIIDISFNNGRNSAVITIEQFRMITNRYKRIKCLFASLETALDSLAIIEYQI